MTEQIEKAFREAARPENPYKGKGELVEVEAFERGVDAALSKFLQPRMMKLPDGREVLVKVGLFASEPEIQYDDLEGDIPVSKATYPVLHIFQPKENG